MTSILMGDSYRIRGVVVKASLVIFDRDPSLNQIAGEAITVSPA